MAVLNWEKPRKLEASDVHNEKYQSDSGISGTYVPNMSDEDKRQWKAVKIGGKIPRVEVRKTVGNTQMLIIVHPNEVRISSNGRMMFDELSWMELTQAVTEAQEELTK